MRQLCLRGLSLALAIGLLLAGLSSCLMPVPDSTTTTTEGKEDPTVENTTEEITTAEPVVKSPKKYFTIRFDDGVTQDARVMEILRKYGLDCCTFYINTGLLGANWAWVGQQNGRPDVTHLRYTQSELRSGIYDGFDVQSHSLNHLSLKNCTDSEVTYQYVEDARRIKALYGYAPVGTAWAGGDTEYTEHSIDVVYKTTDIRYGICARRNTDMGLDKFSLPAYFLTWYPTCSFSDGDSMELLEEFIAAEPTEDMLMLVWCHSYEMDLYDSWDEFDLYIKTIAEAAEKDDSIVLVTNSEFYELFKDEIPSWRD